MKIWTVTYHDDHSNPCSSVHLSQAEADAAASEWVSGYAPIPEGQTWQEVVEKHLFIDSITVEVHELDVTALVLGDVIEGDFEIDFFTSEQKAQDALMREVYEMGQDTDLPDRFDPIQIESWFAYYSPGTWWGLFPVEVTQ